MAVVRYRKWNESSSPKKILVMRFQALGDTLITLPYVNSLKKKLPGAEIHLLTRKEVAEIPTKSDIFNKVIAIGGGRNSKKQFCLAMLLVPFLWLQKYDIVIDLQNHWISRIIRKILFTKAWAEFDRSSAIPAGERTRLTIESLGFALDIKFNVSIPAQGKELLESHGLRRGANVVVLNPAGAFPSRNWPIINYVNFASLWLKEVDANTQFVLLLTSTHVDKGNEIKKMLGANCIDLTGKTSQTDAFSIISYSSLVLSEDSGLLHMAWTQGIPTLALFSSSRKDWSQPLGERAACLDSSDLECGPCMLETCKFNDNRCLVRYTPAFVLRKALTLLEGIETKTVLH